MTDVLKPDYHLLSESLPAEVVRERPAPGGRGPSRSLSYVQGWWVIAEANRVFGVANWDRDTKLLNFEAYEDPDPKAKRWLAHAVAQVRITVRVYGESEVTVFRDGTGTGTGIGANRGLALEAAVKEAETDATKRALATFGWRFGLALYDPEKEHVAPSGEIASLIEGARELIECASSADEIKEFLLRQINGKRVNDLLREHDPELHATLLQKGAKLRQQENSK